MKIFPCLIFLVLIAHLLPAQNTVTVYGTITQPEGDMVYVKYFNDYLTYDEIIAGSGQLDKDGNFNMTFNRNDAFPATFYHGDEITKMYLIPGDSIRLTLDTREFDETVRYEGRGGVVNTYLAQKILQFPPQDGSSFKL